MQVDFAGLYVDIGNGYDAWAIDNGFTTYSDDPGRDAPCESQDPRAARCGP